MLSIEEIKRRKKECGFTNAQLSKLSGVPLGTVQKVLGNTTKSPGIKTMQALSEFFEKNRKTDYLLKEASGVYGYKAAIAKKDPADSYNTNSYSRQGSYTLNDYYALPDEKRVELIDGVFYDMAAPMTDHQLIAGEIYVQVRNYIRNNKGKCIPFIAPTDVQLDLDNKTMVQPDVFVVCDKEKISNGRVLGAPDFIVEVLSKSTKLKDVLIKALKYKEAGVKEYWMIDQEHKQVIVYDYREDIVVRPYTFEDKIPVLIYDGDLIIDMKELTEYLKEVAAM